MSLTLVGTGGCFTRLGAFSSIYNTIIQGAGTLSPSSSVTWGTGQSPYPIRGANTGWTNVWNQFLTNQKPVMDEWWTALESYRTSLAPALTSIVQTCGSGIVSQVNDYQRMISPGSITEAFGIIYDEMKASTQSIFNNTVSLSTSADPTNEGTMIVASSLIGPDGVTRQRVYPETMVLTVTDSAQLTATAGSEPCTLLGTPQVDSTAWNWPYGSGANLSLIITDPSLDAQQNLLVNSDFQDFTVANIPDQWSIAVGSAGATVFEGAAGTGLYGGTSTSLAFLGNGSQLTAIVQDFDDATNGTPSQVFPLGAQGVNNTSTVYGVQWWQKVNTTPAAGVLAFSLVDESNNVITNEAGTNLTVTQSLTGLTSTYASSTGFFQTPRVLPSETRLKIHLTTALTNAVSLNISNVSFISAPEAYPDGPFVGVYRGTVDPALGDNVSITVANNLSGQLMTTCWRFFGTQVPQLQSSTSPTIPDSLVT